MSTTDPLLVGQWQLDGDGDNIVMGRGTVYGFEDVTGLGAPSYKSQDTQLGSVTGEWSGRDTLGWRDIQATIGVSDEDPDLGPGIGPALAQLANAMRPRTEAVPLRICRFGTDEVPIIRWLWVRPRDFDVKLDDSFYLGLPKALVRFRSADPRVYADTETSSGGGTVNNAGNVATYPVYDGGGPVTINGKTLTLTGSTTVDFGTRLATDPSLLVPGSAWGRLEPGDNDVSLGGGTLTYRSAWLTV